MQLAIASRRALRAASSLLAWLTAPATIIALLLIGACGLLVGGVFTLWGQGWAMLAGAAALLLLAAALARGMVNA